MAAAALPADWTMAAITGAAGLAATLAAISRGACVALANKEALVCAGEVMLRAVRDAGATLLPVDSEHNAIFQALENAQPRRGRKNRAHGVRRPVPHVPRSTKWRSPRRTWRCKHPVWSMGAKISIDSATLMNKGLELIEAARLFGLAEPQIGVLVHPQSVIHGLVFYRDGSVLAQLGSPDMRIPIAHTLAWPERMATPSPRLDLASVAGWTSRSRTPSGFPRCAWRATRCAPAVAPRQY